MVALTLLGPGVVVYLLLWVLMPTPRTPRPAGPGVDRLHGALVQRDLVHSDLLDSGPRG